MHTDVLCARATATGAITSTRARVKSIHWVGVTGAGRITLTDGNGGSTKIDVDTAVGSDGFFIGGDGVLFSTGIYAGTLTNITGVTVSYSG